MAKNKPTKIVSKKHLARLERERRQTMAISFAAIGVIAVVVVLLVYGILNQVYLIGVNPAVTVNGEKVSMREFQSRIKVQRQQMVGTYMQYYTFAVSYGLDPTTDQTVSPALTQIQQQLDASNNSVLGGQVMDTIINELLIRQYAQKNGIVVTAADVQNKLQDAYSYFPNGTLTPTITLTPVLYSTLSSRQLNLVTATPTSTPTITPTAGPTLTPVPTTASTPLPTETPISQKSFNQQFQDSVKFYGKFGVSEAQFRQIFVENNLYEERVKPLVTADVPHATEQVWVHSILVADEATAQEVYAQLMAGGDFATLATKYSLDTSASSTSTSYDLGWVGRGKLPAEVEKVAFSMKVGEISQPIQSTDGLHIIQLVGHEVRPLNETDYQAAVTTAFNDWLKAQRDASTVVIADNWINYVPDVPTIQDAFTSLNATQTAVAPTYLSQRQTLEAIYTLQAPTITPTR